MSNRGAACAFDLDPLDEGARLVLTLLVFDPAEEYDELPTSARSIAAYLTAPPAWRPDPMRTLLACDALTSSENDDLNTFGILEHVVPQLEEASARLGRGELAVLCTSVFNPSVYVRLDPRPDGTTTWTNLGMLPQPYGSYYPLAASPFFAGVGIDQRAALYAYLEHGGAGEWHRPARALLDTARLRAALDEQAALGTGLIAHLAG